MNIILLRQVGRTFFDGIELGSCLHVLAVSGAAATIASDALMNPFDGKSNPDRTWEHFY
jgi:hypothetical protein